MKNNRIFFFLFLTITSLRAMEEDPDGGVVWRGRLVDGSVSCPSIMQQGANSQDKLHKDYNNLLTHIGFRVQEIEKKLEELSIPEKAGWFTPVTSGWIVTKSWIRSAAVWVNEDHAASKKMAQEIIEQLSKRLERDAVEVIPDFSNEDVAQRVQGKIDGLLTTFHDHQVPAIQAQLAYLREYNERITQVESAFDKIFKKQWGE